MRLLTSILLAGCALASVACTSPVSGKWRSDKTLGNGEKNKLEVFDDNKADATVHATPSGDPNAWVVFEFKANWEDQGEEFEFDMNCKGGPCNGDDFKMDCEVIDTDSGDKMDCTADQKWSRYIFNWEPDEE